MFRFFYEIIIFKAGLLNTFNIKSLSKCIMI